MGNRATIHIKLGDLKSKTAMTVYTHWCADYGNILPSARDTVEALEAIRDRVGGFTDFFGTKFLSNLASVHDDTTFRLCEPDEPLGLLERVYTFYVQDADVRVRITEEGYKTYDELVSEAWIDTLDDDELEELLDNNT